MSAGSSRLDLVLGYGANGEETMLLVKTRLKYSEIHGIGLFADEFISRGSIIWTYNKHIDLKLSEEQISTLSIASQLQVRGYAYRQKYSGLYLLCGDDARFMNHSDTPSCIDLVEPCLDGVTVALRDIHPGEEITCDYSVIDGDFVDARFDL